MAGADPRAACIQPARGTTVVHGPFAVRTRPAESRHQPLRNAVDEAYWKKCGIDAYLTDGPQSYDGTYRYVVCP